MTEIPDDLEELDPTVSRDNDPLDQDEEERFDRASSEESYFPFILQYLFSLEEDKREAAVHLISHFECDERLEQPLLKLLNANDEKFVLSGIQAVGLWRHSDGMTHLKALLAKNQYPHLEEEIIIAMGNIGGIEGFRFLKDYTLSRFQDIAVESPMGMVGVEGITQIAMHGNVEALQFLIDHCRHPSWNLRETCADSLSVVFQGKEELPKSVYNMLIELTKDDNKDVRIAAYVSLDELIGLDEKNRDILLDARKKQILNKISN